MLNDIDLQAQNKTNYLHINIVIFHKNPNQIVKCNCNEIKERGVQKGTAPPALQVKYSHNNPFVSVSLPSKLQVYLLFFG